MSKIARPANNEHAEDPIKAFGSRLHAGIIGHLRQHPNETSAEIARALDISRSTTFKAIDRLVSMDLLIADPPRETATRGQWVRYRINVELVGELYFQLGQALGEA